jgi:hypothetical protein
MTFRAKKKQESIRKAVDYSAMSMVIEDKSTKSKDGVVTISAGAKKFEVRLNKPFICSLTLLIVLIHD